MTIAIPRLDRYQGRRARPHPCRFPRPDPRSANGQCPGPRHRAGHRRARCSSILTARDRYIVRSPVPITGQTFGVLFVGGALGFRRGFVAVGAVRPPGRGRPAVLRRGQGRDLVIWGATGGYLIGFAVAGASSVGLPSSAGIARSAGRSAPCSSAAVIYAVGLPWLGVVAGLSRAETIADGLTPFLLWDAVKLVVAGVLFPAAWWVVGPHDRTTARFRARLSAAGHPMGELASSSAALQAPIRLAQQPRDLRPVVPPSPVGPSGSSWRHGRGPRPRCRAAVRPRPPVARHLVERGVQVGDRVAGRLARSQPDLPADDPPAQLVPGDRRDIHVVRKPRGPIATADVGREPLVVAG